MAHESLTLEELALQLGKDRRDIERLASRGHIPGRKVDGEWRFHGVEVRQWLEQELRGFDSGELAHFESRQRSATDSETPVLLDLLHPETIQVPLKSRTTRAVLEELVEVASRTHEVWDRDAILAAVQERENILSTAFDNGVAIPHPRNPLPNALGADIVAFGKSSTGLPFGGPRRSMTDLFFLVLCQDARKHLLVLARIGRMLQTDGFVDALRQAEDAKQAWQLIADADAAISAR